MKMEAGLDTGPILKQFSLPLTGQENIEELHDQAAAMSGKIIVQVLKDYLAVKLIAKVQDDNLSSYVKTIKKEDGRLDFKKSAIELERQIRAFHPWPGSFALTEDNKMLKIGTVAHEIFSTNEHRAGELFLENQNLMLATANGALQIESLQLAGGKLMKAKEFIAGHQNFIGKMLK